MLLYERSLSSLRVQYNNIFRMLLGLLRYCSASGMFADARADSFAAIISYYGQIEKQSRQQTERKSR